MRPKFVYCYDALCGWCYGFSEVVTQLYADYQGWYDFEVLSGGMVPVEYKNHLKDMASYIQEEYQHVEARTGVKFGEAFLNKIFKPSESDWQPTSLAPATAMVVIKELKPEQQIAGVKMIQKMVFQQAIDLDIAESYRALTEELGLDYRLFAEHFDSFATKEKAKYEFALVKQLRVTGFPTLLLQTDERYLYLLSRGFSDYASVTQVLNSVQAEIGQNN